MTQRIFITGASSGIGEGLARAYAKPGAHVGIVARRGDLLSALAEDIEKAGARAHAYAGDVVDTGFMATTARAFVQAAGGVDLVVANAGIGIKDRIKDGDAAEIAALMRVNVIGVTNTVVPFVPAMLAQKSGVLSAVASFAGHRAMPGRTAYCASKAAVISFMDGLRMDLFGSGVHAMSFCPGFVKTPLTTTNKGMRFVIDVDEAVRIMIDAVASRTDTITFPWQMNVLRHIVTRAPEALVRKMAPPPRKASSA